MALLRIGLKFGIAALAACGSSSSGSTACNTLVDDGPSITAPA